MALQGFRHPVVSVDFLAVLQGVFDGVSLHTRLTRQSTRFLCAMSVDSFTDGKRGLYYLRVEGRGGGSNWPRR